MLGAHLVLRGLEKAVIVLVEVLVSCQRWSYHLVCEGVAIGVVVGRGFGDLVQIEGFRRDFRELLLVESVVIAAIEVCYRVMMHHLPWLPVRELD